MTLVPAPDMTVGDVSVVIASGGGEVASTTPTGG